MKFTSNSDLNSFLTQLYRLSGMAGSLMDYKEDMKHQGLTYITYYTALLEVSPLGKWNINFYKPYGITPVYSIELKPTKETKNEKKKSTKK